MQHLQLEASPFRKVQCRQLFLTTWGAENQQQGAAIDVCPGPPNGMCGCSKTTIQDVVAAGYRAIYSDWSTFYLLP